MILSQIPSNYQACFGELLYLVTEAETDQVLEVEIWNSAQTLTLGIKRFKGEASFLVNTANYVQQQFDANPITPISNLSCAVVTAPNRMIGSTIKIDPLLSRRSWHTFGVVDAVALTKLSNSPKIKTIARNESDEISFVAPSCEIMASITLCGQDKSYTFQLPKIIATKDVHVLILTMKDVEARIQQEGYALTDFHSIVVSISANEKEFIQQQYHIESEKRSSVRLCWVNQFGMIDYYSCIGHTTKTATVETKKIYTEQGYKNLGAKTLFSSTLISEYEPEQTLNWLSELIAAPQAWIVEEERLIPINIKSQSITTHAADLSRMELSISSAKYRISQKN